MLPLDVCRGRLWVIAFRTPRPDVLAPEAKKARGMDKTDISVLVVEDDRDLADVLARGLRAEKMQVFSAHTVEEAERLLIEKTLDIIVLDLSLAGREGVEVLEFLRVSGRRVPTIIVSARADVDERIRTLGLGADDYMVKPFAFGELVARIRALLRRSQGSERVLAVGPLCLDLLQRRAAVNEVPLELTLREFDLLACLARYAGTPVSRDTLARDVMQVRSRATPVDNVIEVNISRLRAKLAAAGNQLIATVRGIGYQLMDPS